MGEHHLRCRPRTLLVLALLIGAALVAASPLAAAERNFQRNAYSVTRLVSDQPGVAPHTDGNLVNAWGLTAGPTTPWWVADNGTDKSTLYNGDGTPRSLVVDVAGGDKVPRKGGPGVTSADLLVINKTDLAPLVGADLGVMARDAAARRGSAPTVFLSLVEDRTAAPVASIQRSLASIRAAADQAQQVVNIVNISFRAGAATNIEVIDAERRARDADTAVAIAEDAVRRARLELLTALGRFP